ncbi:MAG: hypothetical protein AAGF24_15625, partial [Cyanobacteria bacterium P01_H01_bin.121]
MQDTTVYQQLFLYFQGSYGLLAAILGMAFMSAIYPAVIALLLTHIIDQLSVFTEPSKLFPWLAGVGGICLLICATDFLKSLAIPKFVTKISCKLRLIFF